MITSQDKGRRSPLLNVLRVLDIPEALGCLAPRQLTLIGAQDSAFDVGAGQEDFVGKWVNVDSETGGLTALAISNDERNRKTQAAGRCHPTSHCALLTGEIFSD